jgi:hypothetical protein
MKTSFMVKALLHTSLEIEEGCQASYSGAHLKFHDLGE